MDVATHRPTCRPPQSVPLSAELEDERIDAVRKVRRIGERGAPRHHIRAHTRDCAINSIRQSPRPHPPTPSPPPHTSRAHGGGGAV